MNYFLLSIIIALLIAILVMAIKWPKTIEISDVAPKDLSPKNL